MKHLSLSLLAPIALSFTFAVIAHADDKAPETKMEPIPPRLETTISPLDHHDEISYRMVRETKVNGKHETLTNTFTDKDGKEAVVEIAEVENGHVVSFHQDQKQWNSTGDIVVKDGKAHFTYTRDGKTKSGDESVGDDFVVTASLMDYVREHWNDVVKGKAVKFKLGVLERREVISFQIKKEKEITYSGKPAYVLKMTPSSMFIAALVNPIYFTSTADGNKLWEIDGRTPMKTKKGDSWKDFDGHTVYKY